MQNQTRHRTIRRDMQRRRCSETRTEDNDWSIARDLLKRIEGRQRGRSQGREARGPGAAAKSG